MREKLKINKPMAGHRTGDIVEIEVDKNCIPLDRFWRNRLKDAEIDGCVELVSKELESESESVLNNKSEKKGNKK